MSAREKRPGGINTLGITSVRVGGGGGFVVGGGRGAGSKD